MEQALEQGGETGEIEARGASGKAKIAAQILQEMMAIDPERAMVVAKSWATGVQHSSRRQEDTDFASLEEYIPYRCFDVGYMYILPIRAFFSLPPSWPLTRSRPSRLWHGLVTFGCAITIPEEEADEVKELLTPALISASLVNDLFSFEKERDDKNVQNAVLVVMREHGCSEEEARRVCKERIRIENANYVRVVKETKARTDLSEGTKRYIEVMQYTLSGNVAWSTQCPRYNAGAKWNELQLLRAEYGVKEYPARWPPKNHADGDLSVKPEPKEPLVNGHVRVNGQKRKRTSGEAGDRKRTNGTNGVNGANGVKRPAAAARPSADSLVLENVMALALDRDLPDLSEDVS